MFTPEMKLRPSKERSYFDQLTDAFIRPPRQVYKPADLGPTTFMVNKLLIFREDFVVASRTPSIWLQCSLFTPVYLKEKSRPVVIYLHGNSSSRMESVCYASMFAAEKMSFLAFDFGGCGISGGDYISLGWYEKQDLLAVIAHTRTHCPLLSTIGVWGRSMGAVTVLLAAAEMDQIETIVADTPFSNLKQLCIDIGSNHGAPKIGVRLAFYLARKKIRKLARYDPKHLDVAKYVQRIGKKTSILFLRGSDDTFIRKEHVDQLYSLFDGEKFLTIFQGNHNAGRPKEVYEQIVRFFQNRLYPKQLLQVKQAEEQKNPEANSQKTDSHVNQAQDVKEVKEEQSLSSIIIPDEDANHNVVQNSQVQEVCLAKVDKACKDAHYHFTDSDRCIDIPSENKVLHLKD